MFVEIKISCPNKDVARNMASSLLNKKWIACAQISSEIESHYIWQNKKESASEILLILKTLEIHCNNITKWVFDQHPYDNPEIIYTKIEGGSPDYLEWIRTNVTS